MLDIASKQVEWEVLSQFGTLIPPLLRTPSTLDVSSELPLCLCIF